MDDIATEMAGLDGMTTGELAERYADLHGQPCRTRHRAYLIRKIAWRIQANAEGDLSERARRRAAELGHGGRGPKAIREIPVPPVSGVPGPAYSAHDALGGLWCPMAPIPLFHRGPAQGHGSVLATNATAYVLTALDAADPAEHAGSMRTQPARTPPGESFIRPLAAAFVGCGAAPF